LININTASQAELESLPYIGPALAGRIIEYRETNGPFESIEEIIEVYGIGQKTFERIKDLITVGEMP
jgi:competence protein ComEA